MMAAMSAVVVAVTTAAAARARVHAAQAADRRAAHAHCLATHAAPPAAATAAAALTAHAHRATAHRAHAVGHAAAAAAAADSVTKAAAGAPTADCRRGRAHGKHGRHRGRVSGPVGDAIRSGAVGRCAVDGHRRAIGGGTVRGSHRAEHIGDEGHLFFFSFFSCWGKAGGHALFFSLVCVGLFTSTRFFRSLDPRGRWRAQHSRTRSPLLVLPVATLPLALSSRFLFPCSRVRCRSCGLRMPFCPPALLPCSWSPRKSTSSVFSFLFFFRLSVGVKALTWRRRRRPRRPRRDQTTSRAQRAAAPACHRDAPRTGRRASAPA